MSNKFEEPKNIGISATMERAAKQRAEKATEKAETRLEISPDQRVLGLADKAKNRLSEFGGKMSRGVAGLGDKIRKLEGSSITPDKIEAGLRKVGNSGGKVADFLMNLAENRMLHGPSSSGIEGLGRILLALNGRVVEQAYPEYRKSVRSRLGGRRTVLETLGERVELANLRRKIDRKKRALQNLMTRYEAITSSAT